MEINPVSTPVVVSLPGEAAALRPALASDARTQRGEGPGEQQDGVGRPASAQDQRIEVRANRQRQAT
ncbi:MAG: hypothetical protein M3Z21_14185, partial [Pseudomonadota bacterium]|nr:hypothetical protein [Pseudomonadota bacterium]